MKNRSILPTALLLATALALPAGAAQGTVTNKDHKFVMEAATGGLEEVRLGQLATERAASADVRSFGQQMVTDHGQANQKLTQLATGKGLTPPTELTGDKKKDYDRLSQLSGAAFDRAYMQAMLTDHRKDVNEFRVEAKSGKDGDVKGWAAKTLPTLEEHLKLAQDANRAVGTSGKKP